MGVDVIVSRKIYRVTKPKAVELTFRIPKTTAANLDLSGNFRTPFYESLKIPVANQVKDGPKYKVPLQGWGAPMVAASGRPGEYYQDPTTKLLYGPKVGGFWGDNLVGQAPLIGYGPPTAMATGEVGDYFFDPAVVRITIPPPPPIQDPPLPTPEPIIDTVPQLYGPKTGPDWTGIVQGTYGNPGGITPLVGSGTPSDSLGVSGDFYVDLAGKKTYGPKGSSWTEAPVRDLITTFTKPAEGSIGDYYQNYGSGLVYGPKVDATWDDLKGWAPWSSKIMAALGSRGDFYLDVAAQLLYGPKVGPTWEGLVGVPARDHLMVQGARPMDPGVLATEDNFQGGYRCTLRVVTPPAFGRVEVSEDKLSFDYYPLSKYWVGRDSFSYSVTNALGYESDAKCVYIIVGL